MLMTRKARAKKCGVSWLHSPHRSLKWIWHQIKSSRNNWLESEFLNIGPKSCLLSKIWLLNRIHNKAKKLGRNKTKSKINKTKRRLLIWIFFSLFCSYNNNQIFIIKELNMTAINITLNILVNSHSPYKLRA